MSYQKADLPSGFKNNIIKPPIKAQVQTPEIQIPPVVELSETVPVVVADTIAIFGMDFQKKYFYFMLFIALAIAGYFVWKWYFGKKKGKGKKRNDDDDESSESDEDDDEDNDEDIQKSDQLMNHLMMQEMMKQQNKETE
jgi:amino acid permease